MADIQKIIDQQVGRNIEYGDDGISLYDQIKILREAVMQLKSEIEKLSKKSISLPDLDALSKKVEIEKARVKPAKPEKVALKATKSTKSTEKA